MVEVFDSRPRGRGFEPHRRYCIVVFEQDIYLSLVLVQPRKTCPCLTERMLMGHKESNQTNKQSSVSSLPASCEFSVLLTTFANSLDPDQT